MGIANLHEIIQASIIRRNELNRELTELQDRKSLSLYSRADVQSLLSSEKFEIQEYFEALYEGNVELQENYIDYTEMPDFEKEINRITAEFQEQLDELTAWETGIDQQITTNSAELEEVNAYLSSYKEMLSSNIQEDFNYGLNG